MQLHKKTLISVSNQHTVTLTMFFNTPQHEQCHIISKKNELRIIWVIFSSCPFSLFSSLWHQPLANQNRVVLMHQLGHVQCNISSPWQADSLCPRHVLLLQTVHVSSLNLLILLIFSLFSCHLSNSVLIWQILTYAFLAKSKRTQQSLIDDILLGS